MATYKEVCDEIAEVYNLGPGKIKLTGEDVFTFHPKGELFFLQDLYAVSQDGPDALIDLFISDPFYAKMLVKKLESKCEKEHQDD